MRVLITRALIACLAVLAPAAAAQESPVSAFNKTMYGHLTAALLKSAEKMPEESFGFKPVESVRSYGQILGHAADAQYYFCSAALGEKNPAPKVEKTKTGKAELMAAMKEAFTYCGRAYDAVNDTDGQKVSFMNQEMTKVNVLTVNLMHIAEHYGNLVTYMRMKGIVPPSTEVAQAAQAKKP